LPDNPWSMDVSNINARELLQTLGFADEAVWMAALRSAAKSSTVPIIPWDSCPFLNQHKELVRLTGFGETETDHQHLHNFLQQKAKRESYKCEGFQ
jgi:hypothetical protein